ncbi:hypothetical protein WICMUC_005347 [Wickerhamomyces mucosus]|uniref:pyridoxal kinase n=1 Tax=Wickerhamomyces mucosus TaxID=1378264 RepID=A0A9P8P8K2_9ASCO|nr:hypothetical protein WICMUC_005347 [Wickerhamomyces mucosus]
MTVPEIKTILSIQSHVVHGYVGNKSATFPLQCQGWDVDVLNSVNFSNHTGYGSVKGTKITLDQLKDLYRGLKDIGTEYDALLTGYIPNHEILSYIGEIGEDIKSKHPESLWLLDPVMGDEGQLYVSESVIPIYKKILLGGLVDIITPNQFEAEILLDFKITSIDTLKTALKEFHTRFKLKNIVISSCSLPEYPNEIITVCSQITPNSKIHSHYFEVPIIESYFTGVGDLFSSLLIDRVYKYRNSDSSNYLITSVNEVLTIMSKILQTTSKYAEIKTGRKIKSKMGSANTMKEFELKLIQCRDLYGSTEKTFNSTHL